MFDDTYSVLVNVLLSVDQASHLLARLSVSTRVKLDFLARSFIQSLERKLRKRMTIYFATTTFTDHCVEDNKHETKQLIRTVIDMIKNTTANKSPATGPNEVGRRRRRGGDRHCICAMTIIVDRAPSPWNEKKKKREERKRKEKKSCHCLELPLLFAFERH